MKIILLSFVILSVVEGAVFTAFHPAQVDFVHGPRGKSNFQSAGFNEGNIRIQPASKSFFLKPLNHKTLLTYPGYQVNNVHAQDLYREDLHLQPTINTSNHKQDILKVPTIQERPQKQTGFLQRIPLLKSAGNIVDQTKAFANSAKSLFKLFENNDHLSCLRDTNLQEIFYLCLVSRAALGKLCQTNLSAIPIVKKLKLVHHYINITNSRG